MATSKTTTTSKAPAASKPAAAKKPAVSRKKTATTKKPVAGAASPSPEERYRMVAVAAYFLAERNNFEGNPVDYWIAAEAQIARQQPR